MDYTTLSEQIIAYADRKGSTEFIDALPYFIEMGQQKIWKELNTTGIQQATPVKTFLANNAIIEKPVDWQETISIIYGAEDNFFQNNVTLFPRSYEFCINYWPNINQSDHGNPPLFYSDYQAGNKYETPYKYYLIVPTPDKAYTYQITYIGRPKLITAENPTNILTDYYPDLLFYAAFLEALIYLKDDQRMPVYSKLYQESLLAANNLTQDRYIDRSVKRDVG